MFTYLDRKLKTKDAAPNESKYFLYIVNMPSTSSRRNFDLLGFLPSFWTVPPFQRMYYLSFCCNFVLYSIHET